MIQLALYQLVSVNLKSEDMIVSALLTSVGINSGLCILYFTLYSTLRRQPANFEVYEPRLLAEKQLQRSRTNFHVEWLIPSPGWVKRAWQLTEDELLSLSGLDAVVFMRIIIFSLKVFSFAGMIGVFVLLPVNCSGNQLAEFNIANVSSDSLDIFTISNVNSGSGRLWVHFCAVYMVTVFVCWLLYYEYSYVSNKRIQYFNSSKPQPHQFTILVRGVPVAPGGSITESVDNFFNEYHPSTYLSHTVIHRTNKLRNLINDGNILYRRLRHLKSEINQPNNRRSGFLGMFGRRVNLVDQYEKELEGIEENLRSHRGVSLAAAEVRAAFVSFKSQYGAAVALSLQQSTNPTEWIAERAPEPRDVYWPFFQTSFLRNWISKVVVLVVSILITALFVLPVLLVQGLTNLDQLEALFPFLTSILSISVVSQIVTGYLPSLILQLFLKLVPPVMMFLSSIQGYISFSEIQKSACKKFLWFTIWNIFFANVLSGSVLNQLSDLLDLKNIPAKLAVAVPGEASFFIAYVVTSGWTSTSSELFRLIPFIGSLLQKCCCCCCKKNDDASDEFKAPCIPYHVDIPRLLFFGLLGLTYFFLAPLILPFLLVYFCLAYIIFKNQFINVYAPKYETAGRFWPIVHNSMIFSLILMHAIAIGIFTLKKLALASTLIFPLPILTLLFNEYCRKRFLPNFTGYAAEILIKKDRDDSRDPAMGEFFDRLVNAYQDPALAPLRFSQNSDDRTAPLLSNLVTDGRKIKLSGQFCAMPMLMVFRYSSIVLSTRLTSLVLTIQFDF
ncbi:hypothetical protein V2J09_012985 [Rumex salicifolius]